MKTKKIQKAKKTQKKESIATKTSTKKTKKGQKTRPTVKSLMLARKPATGMEKSVLDSLKTISVEVMSVTITPKIAIEILEANTINRPIRQKHVERIGKQIADGLWKLNGQTIKISPSLDVLDGQHRLWGCVTADREIVTLVVTGVDPEAWSTIDTLQQNRTGGDVLALEGVEKYRTEIATAVAWLTRWQHDNIPGWNTSSARIENSDTKETFNHHPNIVRAVERVAHLRGLVPVGVMGFLYYILASRNLNLADRLVDILEDPSGTSVKDPFYKFRSWLIKTSGNKRRRDPVIMIALAFKAWIAAENDQTVTTLTWRKEGNNPEAFPSLNGGLANF